MLGKSREAYISYITDSTKWGGQVELSILSTRFRTEIAAIDIQSGRIDTYGQGSQYTDRVYMLFSGIHFDAVVFGTNQRCRVNPNDHTARRSAEALATGLRSENKFTDQKTMALVCKTCGHEMKGDFEARSHAGSSGHTDFVMKK